MKINQFYKTKNFDYRPEYLKVDYIILHYTDRDFDVSLDLLTKSCDNPVSSHFLIDQNGIIFQLLDVELRAWHAGISHWKGYENLNNNSIGIEIVNFDQLPYTNTQIQSCIELCRHLMQIYNIAPKNVLGHSDIAPYRKKDPGCHFPWDQLIQSAIVPSLNKVLSTYNRDDPLSYLKMIGYDTRPIENKPTMENLLLTRFQSRFCQNVITGQLNDETHNMINRVTQAYCY